MASGPSPSLITTAGVVGKVEEAVKGMAKASRQTAAAAAARTTGPESVKIWWTRRSTGCTRAPWLVRATAAAQVFQLGKRIT
jgi:hypothetical protein